MLTSPPTGDLFFNSEITLELTAPEQYSTSNFDSLKLFP